MGSQDEPSDRPLLGRCPNCDSFLSRSTLLISYETEHSDPRLFAECPSCEEPVHPL